MNWNSAGLCWIIFSVCRCGLQSASGHYYGTEIGSFNVEGATEGGAGGTVYAVNKSCIFIRGFSFDGNRQDRDARFSVGCSPKPDDHGVLIPDETGSNKSLGTYFQRDVLLNLPLDVKVTKISWIAVWDLSEKVHYGYINISQTPKPPEEKGLGVFTVDHLGYHFHIDDIIIYNIKQILFVNVGYDGLKAGSSVWIGNGGLESPEWSQELFHEDRDLELSTQQPLNITITLPGNLTVDDLDSVRIWIGEEDEILGHFIISDEDKEILPPYLPNLVEIKDCEILVDRICQVSWQLDESNNKITLELSGRITLNEYMAFGISGSDNKMVGSDVIVVWIDPTTNEPQAEDYHLSDNSKCIGNIGIDVCPDTFVSGGTNDVQLIGAVIRDGITTIRVSRPLTSDDSLDNPIQTDRRVLTFWSLGPKFKITSMSHSQVHTSGMREVNFGTSEVSDCPDLELVEEEEKGNSFSKLFSDLSNNVAEEVPSLTGRHISKRSAGSPDPPADLVTNACCFTDCQNGGIGFATVNQQLQCVCPSPWTGPDCATTTTPCNPDPCQNGGTCSVVSGTAFQCDCTAGFTGTTCGLVDGDPFQVLCPSNVHLLTTGGNSPSVSATWQEPDAPGYQLIMRSHTPGDLFSVGETIVDYTFGTSQGTQTCTFCVTVQEVTMSQPTLDNCLDVTSSSSSQDGMNVTFTEPTASDGCGPVSLLSATARSGDFFSLGTTSVLFFFENRCEELSLCTIAVTVNVVTPCPGDIMLESNQALTTVEWMEAGDSTMFFITSRTAHSGDLFPVGMTEVMISYFDVGTNELRQCTFTITITTVDTTNPQITCPEVDPVVIEIRTGGTIVTWLVPTATDLSPTSVTCTRSPGEFYTTGMATVTCTAVDQFGNSNSCTFVVSVIEEDTIPPIISNCPDDISRIIELGLPSAVISWPEPSASDVSGTVTLSARSHDPGSSFMLGLTTVEYIFVDPTGNAATCSFMVNVMAVDTTPPTIEDCPSRLEGVVELGTSGAVMDWMEPSASDVSGVAMLVSRSHAPGLFFNVGTTQVSYTFTDDSGNEAVCAFIISITTG